MFRGEDCKNCISSNFSDDNFTNSKTLIKCYNDKVFPPNMFLNAGFIIKEVCKNKVIRTFQSKLEGVIIG